MDNLTERIANLSPEKRALLEQKLIAERDTGPEIPVISRRESTGACPLSFAQERVWFLEQFEPGSPIYNVPMALRMEGPLNIAALHDALNAVVRRHEALRTNLVSIDGSPAQVIRDFVSVDITVRELSSLCDPPENTAIEQLLAEEVGKPFDLAQDQLLRALLLRLSEDLHILLLTIHHAVFDGRSIEVLLQELGALYAGFCSGNSPTLPGLPVQYADFALWQRNWLQGQVLENQIAYWRQQLGGELAVLNLPTDHARPPLYTAGGAHEFMLLPEALSEALDTLSRSEGVTLFMTLLAAFTTLLYRHSDQDNIIIGSPISGRNRVELEDLIGFFVNTLALRIDLAGEPTFLELLSRTRQVALEAYAHQDLPFEKLVAELQPDRHLSHTPLFQVAFQFTHAPGQTPEFPGLRVDTYEFDSRLAKFDLALNITERPAGFLCEMEYRTDLFESGTITRMLEHFRVLLESIIADPEQPISRLQVLTEAERRQLLVEWNDTEEDYPRDKCVHELFEAQVAQTPNATALLFDQEQLTYSDLNRRSNQLAHHLRALGIESGSLVGLCVERSVEMVVGMIAILKAGSAYVPLDPDHPAERLTLMLEDTAPPVVLTKQRYTSKLSAGSQHKVYLDQGDKWAVQSQDNPYNVARPDGLAYVMYTSGSTGTPKGVCVSHRAINRLVCNTDYIALQPADRVAQASHACFDAATFEIWGALLHGARLVYIGRDTLLSPWNIGEQIRALGISVLFLTTALFNLLAREAPSAFSTVRYLLFGGETVDPSAVRTVLANEPPEHLLHVYGPTESATFTTWYPVQYVAEDAATVPIGRPISNTQVYLLDRNLQPVPVRVPGELHIGGDGLAHGYLNSPGLTAERFIPNPFGNHPDARLYRTGDLGRYLTDGNIEFLGRTDDQVKIRGFRVEPGEIEVALGRHPSVREAAIVVREDSPGDKRLVAYIVPQEAWTISTQELDHFLRETLPQYMIPSAFVVLDALPLTGNAKLDREALPPPKDSQAREPYSPIETSPAVARDELEAQLKEMWEEALGVESVMVTDNFFELGGHSLLAAQVFAQIEERLGKRFPVSLLFRAPTIRQLAEVLRGEGWSPAPTSLVAIQPEGSRRPVFLAHPGAGDVLCYARLAQYLAPDQRVYGFRARGLEVGEEPSHQLELMATQYIAEMKSIQPEGPYYLAGYSGGGSIVYEMACQLRGRGEKVGCVAIIDHSAPQSGYRKVWRLFHPWLAYHFLRELPYGPLYFFYKTSRERRKTLRRVAARLVRYARRLVGGREPARAAAAEQLPGGSADKLAIRLEARQRANDAVTNAVKNYVPRPYGGYVTLFRSRRQRTVSSHDPEMGWGQLARGGLKVVVIPGDHGHLLDEPFVGVLAPKLQACLDEARAND